MTKRAWEDITEKTETGMVSIPQLAIVLTAIVIIRLLRWLTDWPVETDAEHTDV